MGNYAMGITDFNAVLALLGLAALNPLTGGGGASVPETSGTILLGIATTLRILAFATNFASKKLAPPVILKGPYRTLPTSWTWPEFDTVQTDVFS
jgi:hypothetical protein